MSIPVPADEPDPYSHANPNGSGQDPLGGAPTVIDIEIETRRPRLEMRMQAEKDALPLVRQALRALAQSIGADPEGLQDAELALTEACANAVRHAYRDGAGMFDVALEARPRELLAIVRDEGRGMRDPWGDRGRDGGLGLTVIESIARDVEIRSERGVGTEVVMALPGARYEPIDEESFAPGTTVEQVVRRLVAMAAAQSDLPAGRVTEALLAAEMIARHAADRVAGDRVHVRLDQIAHGIDLRVGPLEAGGTAEILRDADVAVLGSVIERFADRVWAIPAADGSSGEGERLAARFLAG